MVVSPERQTQNAQGRWRGRRRRPQKRLCGRTAFAHSRRLLSFRAEAAGPGARHQRADEESLGVLSERPASLQGEQGFLICPLRGHPARNDGRRFPRYPLPGSRVPSPGFPSPNAGSGSPLPNAARVMPAGAGPCPDHAAKVQWTPRVTDAFVPGLIGTSRRARAPRMGPVPEPRKEESCSSHEAHQPRW